MEPLNLTNEFSFHDSSLERIDFTNGNIRLLLDSASAPPCYTPEQKEDEIVVLRNVSVVCIDAATTRLEYWIDDKDPVEHPTPEQPVDEIMRNDLADGLLKICGFGSNSAWVEWHISASSFKVSWGDVTPYKLNEPNKAAHTNPLPVLSRNLNDSYEP